MATGQINNAITEKLLGWVLSQREPTARRDPGTGRFGLPYGRAYRMMVMTCLVLVTGLLVASMVGTGDDLKAFLIVTVIFGLGWVSLLVAAYEMRHVTIEFSEEGLFKSSPLSPGKSLPWDRISTIRYSEMMKWLTLHGPERRTVRISIYRSGLETFADMAGDRLRGTPVESDIPLIHEAISRPF